VVAWGLTWLAGTAGVESDSDTLGLDLSSLPSWPVIDELRLVANVVKHGEGDSAEKLRETRPELFVYPSLRDHTKPLERLWITAKVHLLPLLGSKKGPRITTEQVQQLKNRLKQKALEPGGHRKRNSVIG
jgi:hypothetical protein